MIICKEISMPALRICYGRNDFDDDKEKYPVESRPIYHDRYGKDGTGGFRYLPTRGRIWKNYERNAE